MGFSFFKEKQDKVFLVLDIGTEAVKALIVKKDKSENIVLAASIQYFERFGVFDSKDFDKDLIKKAILKSIECLLQNFPADFKNLPILLTLPPNIFKARVISQLFERDNPEKRISELEKKNICQQVLRTAKEKISKDFASNSGILPSEIHWISLKILGIKIDGYSVSELSGYEGRNLDFKILATFLPRYYLENIKSIFRDLDIGVSQLIHIAENLSRLFREKQTDAVFIDVGGEVSQIFLVKKSGLEEISDFAIGGRIFSQVIAGKLGITEDSARILKERYSQKLLTPEAEKKIKEILLSEKINWQKSLRLEFLSLPVFLFGGGCLVPEIQEALNCGSRGVEVLYSIEKLKSPQYIPSLLII